MSVDFYGLCRLCMSKDGEKLHIFKDPESYDRQLPSKLENYIPIQIIENDTLPKEVCENCIMKIEEFHDFIEQCVNAEFMFKSYFETFSISNNLKCQEKGYIREFSDSFVSPEKSDISDSASTKHSMESLSNIIESGSIQIVNDINNQFEDFCKYDVQPVISSKTNGDYSNQTAPSDSYMYEHDASENIQTVYSGPDVLSVSTVDSSIEDSEMSMHSSPHVTSLTVEPEMLHIKSSESENDDTDSDLENSEFEVFDEERIYTNWFLPLDYFLASCAVCGEVLKSKEDIVMHIPTCEAIDKNELRRSAKDMMQSKFPCNVRKKTFEGKENLTQNTTLHTRERRYNCETCSKSYGRKEHLTRHQLSHSGLQLYKCDLCNKGFNRKDNLNMHKNRHN